MTKITTLKKILGLFFALLLVFSTTGSSYAQFRLGGIQTPTDMPGRPSGPVGAGIGSNTGAPTSNSTSGLSINTPSGYSTNLGGLISGFLSFAMAIGAILLLLYLVWGAIEWISSGGDKGKVENARNKITQAVIGMLVLGATVAIFMLVQRFMGISVLRFPGGASGS